jgi:hypothetical protein
MKLTDLEPRWLLNEGEKRWFIFRSPSGTGDWLTCRNFKFESGEDTRKIYETCPELRGQPIVGCNKDFAWKITGNDFSDLTCHPSIDASASGNWHGFIIKGQIT